MSAASDTTNNENVLPQKKGNHKGCPYGRLAGGCFRGKDSSEWTYKVRQP